MITREQVADLQAGDVVELHTEHKGVSVRGPLHPIGSTGLGLGTYIVRNVVGEPFECFQNERTLTVISRAPRPLYVNHDRARPVPGDVVRTGDGRQFMRTAQCGWLDTAGEEDDLKRKDGLRLLVDGNSGQVVQ